MTSDIRFILPNRPGTLVAAAEALAASGLNLIGVSGDLRPGETWGYAHVLVDEPEKARAALEEAGLEVTSEHEVDLVEIEDRPGAIRDACRTYAERDDNIEVLYMARDRLVIGTESMRRSRSGVRVEDARYD